MKVGVLYPRSSAHPNADIDFVDGMRSCLEDGGRARQMELKLEGVGFGGAEKEVYEKVERLLRMERVDIIVAFVDLKVTPLLEPLLFTSDKLMIVVNPGANYPLNWTPQSNIIYLTLHHAFLTWLAGGQAVRQSKTSAAMASTFYDCGYLHGATMMDNFVKRGGEPAYNYVNNQRYDDQFEISPLLHFLAENKDTRSLLCTFDAAPAALFYHRLNQNAEAGDLHLYVSPMMLEATALHALTEGLSFSIDGYSTWLPSQGGEANRHFRTVFEQQTGRAASIFALLGWEAALVVGALLGEDGKPLDTSSSVAALTDNPLSSPRGPLRLDKATHFFLSPVLHCHAARGARQLTIESCQEVQEAWQAFHTSVPDGVASGWTNTYLCY